MNKQKERRVSKEVRNGSKPDQFQKYKSFLITPDGYTYDKGSYGYRLWEDYPPPKPRVCLTSRPTKQSAFAILGPHQELKQTVFFKKNHEEEKPHDDDLDSDFFCFNEKDPNCVHVNDQCMVLPTLNPQQRDILFVAGKSGCGKSSFAAQFANLYRKLWRKKTGINREIYLFSSLKEDPSIDRVSTSRILLDEEFLYQEINVRDEFSDCLVIFDDVDSMGGSGLNNKIKKKVSELLNDCLETGRHSRISVVYCSHLMTNYSKTRTVLNEANYIVGFDVSMNRIFDYCLDHYFKLSKSTVESLKKFRSRWIALHNNSPFFLVHEHGWCRESDVPASLIKAEKREKVTTPVSDSDSESSTDFFSSNEEVNEKSAPTHTNSRSLDSNEVTEEEVDEAVEESEEESQEE